MDRLIIISTQTLVEYCGVRYVRIKTVNGTKWKEVYRYPDGYTEYGEVCTGMALILEAKFSKVGNED